MNSIKTIRTILIIAIITSFMGCGDSEDNEGSSVVSSQNKAPTANAGVDKTVTVNTSITLVGTGIDSDGIVTSYEWKKGSDVLATTAQFDYIPTVIGTDILTLTVTDDDGLTATDNVKIIVNEVIVNGKTDLAKYKPNKSMTKNYTEKFKYSDEEKEEASTLKEEVIVINNTISIITTYSDNADIDKDISTINSDSITYEWNDAKNSAVSDRYVNIGDITFENTTSNTRCTLVQKLTTFSHAGYEYNGDIIKEKCTSPSYTSYIYSKKDLGLIASIGQPDTNFDYYNTYYTTEKESIPNSEENNSEESDNVISTVSKSWITPTEKICSDGGGEMYGSACGATWENATNICTASGGVLATIQQLNKVVTDCGGVINSENNVDNSSYQTCYKEEGFTTAYYWSSTMRKADLWDKDIFGVAFLHGSSYPLSPLHEYYIKCKRK